MPYKSLQQEKWAHTPDGLKALGGKQKVSEWDKVSKGLNLPQMKKQSKSKNNGNGN